MGRSLLAAAARLHGGTGGFDGIGGNFGVGGARSLRLQRHAIGKSGGITIADQAFIGSAEGRIDGRHVGGKGGCRGQQIGRRHHPGNEARALGLSPAQIDAARGRAAA